MDDSTKPAKFQPYRSPYIACRRRYTPPDGKRPRLVKQYVIYVNRDGSFHTYQNYWIRSHFWWYASDYDGHISGATDLLSTLADVICEPTLSSQVYSPEDCEVDKPPYY